jgi:hypothetical protein
MRFKVLGVLGCSGTPEWTEYYCERACLDEAGVDRGDAEQLSEDDFADMWVTPRRHVLCTTCGRHIFSPHEIVKREDE